MNRYSLQFLLVAILLAGCKQEPDFKKEEAALMAMHNDQRKAHLEKNAKLFVDQFADSLRSVNKGKLSIITKEAALKRFQGYFDAVEFKKWDDVNPPVISFSDDASLAYITVDKQVVLTYKNEKNGTTEESTHFTWVSIAKKMKTGEWKIVCNISTNEPEIVKPVL